MSGWERALWGIILYWCFIAAIVIPILWWGTIHDDDDDPDQKK